MTTTSPTMGLKGSSEEFSAHSQLSKEVIQSVCLYEECQRKLESRLKVQQEKAFVISAQIEELNAQIEAAKRKATASSFSRQRYQFSVFVPMDPPEDLSDTTSRIQWNIQKAAAQIPQLEEEAKNTDLFAFNCLVSPALSQINSAIFVSWPVKHGPPIPK
jgi:hypothetical protein